MILLKILFTIARALLSPEYALAIRGFPHAKHLISKKELYSYTQEFLNHYGYGLSREHRILIKFIPRKYILKPTRYGSAGILSYSRLKSTMRINIYMPTNKSKKELLKTLFHELDHVIWAWENNGTFDSTKPYLQRPHEIRAHEREITWTEKILST